jgi:hypothetical protein
MKIKSYPETSFFAKMLLLFALVFMGQPEKRKDLAVYLNGIFHYDSAALGQIQTAKLINTSQLQSSIPR